MPWGMGGPIAALAVSRCAVPQTARCIRAGRGSPRVGTYRTRSQRVSDQEDANRGLCLYTRGPQRRLGSPHTEIAPAAAVALMRGALSRAPAKSSGPYSERKATQYSAKGFME